MQFTFDRDAMIKEISIAQEVISIKSPVSIISNILLIAENNALVIKATDSTINFATYIPVDIQEEGRTTVYCDKFMNILSSLPSGEVEFIQEDIEITIKPIAKRFKAKLKSQTDDKFPEKNLSDNIPFFEIPSSDFKEMIRETIFATSTDTSRMFMSGCYLVKEDDNLTLVATDGRRLSCDIKKGLNIPDITPANIPTKILNLVLKHAPSEGNIQLAIVESAIFVKFGTVTFQSSLVGLPYPNYKRVIPEGLTKSFQVNKKDLDEALKRTAVMIDKKVYRMIMKITSGELELICPESETGESNEIIPCRYEGNPLVLALNYNYLVEPLKVIDSEDVLFEFDYGEANEGEEVRISKPIVMRGSDNSDYFHVVMPMNY